MNELENLSEALKIYEIGIISIEGRHVKVQNNFEIEVEAGGLYKLYDDGYVVAPFDDLNELCMFIINSTGN